jgi:hypothetical protein
MWSKRPRRSELHHRADVVLRDDHLGADVRLLHLLGIARHVRRVVHLDPVAVLLLHRVGDVRRGHEQIEVELPLEPLADDLHVQEPEEAAAEAEPECLRRLGLVEQRRVVELELLEGVAELGVVVRVGREEAREDHRLDLLVARQRSPRAAAAGRQRVAHAETRHVLEPRDDVAHLPRLERVDRDPLRRHEAELLRVEVRAHRHRMQRGAGREPPVDDADERDHPAVLVVARVEDERARGRIRLALRGRDPLDDRIEYLVHIDAGLRRDADDPLGRPTEQLRHLGGGAVGVGRRQVDLVHDRDDLEVVLDGEIRVGEGLRLDPLSRVDDEHRTLARLQRARDLVREVDMARRVDQVELVPLPLHPNRLRLDRDPALALELHRVEHLVPHLALGDGLRQLQDPVGEGRLAMVDVRDDREVANAALVHG